MARLTYFRLFRRPTVALALAAAVVFSGAQAHANDPDSADGTSDDASEPDHLAAFYRRVALPPYLERRVQAILQAEWEAALANAEKVGLRRMSRSRYRRALVALDRSTDAKIRKLVGRKKFLAWNRARMDPMRNKAGRAVLAARMQRPYGSPAPSSRQARQARNLWTRDRWWTRDRCAGLARLLRGSLGNTTVEEAHFWIHDHARHC
jgi:hypothetical protein